MKRLKLMLRNLRFLFTRELQPAFDVQEHKLDERIDAFELRANERADAYERAVDRRQEERDVVIDRRLDERFGALEQRLDIWQVAQEQRTDERASNYEASLDARFEERFAILEQRSDERLIAIEQHNDAQFAAIEQRNNAQQTEMRERLEQRFDERTRAVDNRMDDRFARIEHLLDERFESFEKRTDARLEAHEKRTDNMLKVNRADIIDRNDVMLQLFEQRLDQQRRELRALREQLAKVVTIASTANREISHEGNGSHTTPLALEPQPILAEAEPVQQVQSFRQLAQSSGLIGKHKLPVADTSLYEKILAWKKVAAEKLNEFTPDEQEVVDYLLSFIHDERERAYTTQHLRRFVATLQRIPPPQRSTDRLLELGSLVHLLPAIKKFCGYGEVYGADFWEGEERITQETLKQVNGNESHTLELRNFNVEADPFPYPDSYFRVVLCCELIEHLQRDPLHMLWEINRVLQDDGFLLLTTPNIASVRSLEGLLIGCAPYLLSQYNLTTPADQHNREYAPYEVGLALAAAGFTVIQLETEDVWLRSNPAILKLLEEVELGTQLRGDNIFALARKTSAPIERYPKEFYIE